MNNMKNKRLENFLFSKYMSIAIAFVFLLSYCRAPAVPLMYDFTNIACIVFSIIILFCLIKTEVSKICLTLILYCAILFIATMVGELTSLSILVNTYYKIVVLAFYLDYGLRHYCKNVVQAFYVSLFILNIINFYTIIRYPEGLYKSRFYDNNWFFGYDNNHILMFIPTIMFIFLKHKLYKSKLNLLDFILIGMITYSVYWCFSATSVVAYTVLLIYLLFRKFINKLSIFNSITYLLSYFAMFFSFVIFRVQKIFSVLIVDILGKSLTLSHRTIIWDNTIKWIKERWLLGYGKQYETYFAYKQGDGRFNHAHNTILDVFYQGGIIGLILSIVLLILPVKELFKHRNNSVAKFMAIILFCFFIMMNFEERQEYIGLYLVLISCYNISSILKNIDET